MNYRYNIGRTNNRNFKRPVKFLLMIFVGLIISGCASRGINIVKNGDLVVEAKGSGQVKIVNVYVRKNEGEILIHADVRPTERVRFFQPGHLSFELFTADGEQYLNFDVTRYTREHNKSQISKLKHASFWVRMPLDVPKGSKLKVTHHSVSAHKKNKSR